MLPDLQVMFMFGVDSWAAPAVVTAASVRIYPCLDTTRTLHGLWEH